jgi:hypothetical protein
MLARKEDSVILLIVDELKVVTRKVKRDRLAP